MLLQPKVPMLGTMLVQDILLLWIKLYSELENGTVETRKAVKIAEIRIVKAVLGLFGETEFSFNSRKY
jgi:hypothetical protein